MKRRSIEELEKIIKKSYFNEFSKEILEMYDELSLLRDERDRALSENESLKHKLENERNSPERMLADAIANYIDRNVVSRKELNGLVRKEISDNLEVSVETDGYYDTYDYGQSEHYHKSTASISWKEKRPL